MEFFTVLKEKRPVRLSERTRKFAYESLYGKYGDDAMKNYAVTLDHIEDFNSFSDIKKYDTAIREIALKAPVRLLDEEYVCGSANLGLAISHVIPATYTGNAIFPSNSHLTAGFDRVVYEGIDSFEAEIKNRLLDDCLTERQIEFLNSMLKTIESMRIWHGRYLNAVKDMNSKTYNNLLTVPFKPARTFHEAVQSLWFSFAFMRLCGNWPGIGRIDRILGSYLEKDLSEGNITYEEAREILASFFIKGCEWIRSNTPPGSGDAQHYQNIVLAGVDENGNEVTNAVTFLVLDIIEELGISDFPITVRINNNSSEELLRKVACVIKHGGGVVAVYNESLILDSLVKMGYELKEARKFANDGCWEVQIPGETYFCYVPFDALQILLKKTLCNSFDSFDDLYSSFINDLKDTVESIYESTVRYRLKKDENGWEWSCISMYCYIFIYKRLYKECSFIF